MNNQKLSPQGYNIQKDPVNTNPFWENAEGGNVPAGGLTGQVLTKRTNADYDTEWKTPESGGGSGLPAGGMVGDILKKTADGAAWEYPGFASESELDAVESTANSALSTAEAAQSAVAAERTRAMAAEEALSEGFTSTDEQIAELDAAIKKEVTDRENAIDAETTARTAADTALSGRIDSVASDLSQYKQTTDASLQSLSAADTSLNDLITQEANARADADALLQQDITDGLSTEQTARQNADDSLRTLITGLSGDVTDQTALITDLEGRVTHSEEDITSLQNRMGDAETNIDTVEEDISSLQSSIDNIDDRVTTLEQESGSGGSGDVLPKLYMSDTERGANPVDTTIYTQTSERKYLLVRHVAAGTNQSGDTFKNDPVDANAGTVNILGNDVANNWTYANSVCGSGMGSPSTTGIFKNYSNLRAAFGLHLIPGAKPSSSTYNARKFVLDASVKTGCLIALDTKSNINSGIATDPVSGGTTGQVLTKTSDNDYDWEWVTPAGGSSLPSGGSAGDLLRKTADGEEWYTPSYADKSFQDTVEGSFGLGTDYTTDKETSQYAQVLMLPFIVNDPKGAVDVDIYASEYGIASLTDAIPDALKNNINSLSGRGVAYQADLIRASNNLVFKAASNNNVYLTVKCGPEYVAGSNLVQQFPYIKYTAPTTKNRFIMKYEISITPPGSTAPLTADTIADIRRGTTVTPVFIKSNSSILYARPAGFLITNWSTNTVTSELFLDNQISKIYSDMNTQKTTNFFWGVTMDTIRLMEAF